MSGAPSTRALNHSGALDALRLRWDLSGRHRVTRIEGGEREGIGFDGA